MKHAVDGDTASLNALKNLYDYTINHQCFCHGWFRSNRNVHRSRRPEYAKQRAALINPNRANCDVEAGDPLGSTTYLTVVDRDANIASWIQVSLDTLAHGSRF